MQLLHKIMTRTVAPGKRLKKHKAALLDTDTHPDKPKKKRKQTQPSVSEPPPKARRGRPPKTQEPTRSSARQRKAQQAAAEAFEDNSAEESTDGLGADNSQVDKPLFGCCVQ